MKRKSPLLQRERRYQYRAKNRAGKTVQGIALAPDRMTLSRTLYHQELYLLSAVELRGGERLLKNAFLARFCRELSNLLTSGISLNRAMTIISSEERLNAETRRLCRSVLLGVQGGLSLADAMKREQVFPELFLGMVRLGENTGTLDAVMERMAVHYEKQHQTEQSVRSALTYPIFLCVITLLVLWFLFTLILPRFEALFADMETLPLPTQILLSISNQVKAAWYIPLLTPALLGIAFGALVRIEKVRLWVDRTKLHLPVMGGLLSTLYTARFARSLSSLYFGGLPIVEALSIARDTIGNTCLSAQFDDVLRAVRSGEALSAALGQVKGFCPKLISAIEIGEESGQLDTMLEDIAQTLEFDAGEASKRLLTILDPLLIVIMSLLIGSIMVSIMLPLLSSYSMLENTSYF